MYYNGRFFTKTHSQALSGKPLCGNKFMYWAVHLHSWPRHLIANFQQNHSYWLSPNVMMDNFQDWYAWSYYSRYNHGDLQLMYLISQTARIGAGFWFWKKRSLAVTLVAASRAVTCGHSSGRVSCGHLRSFAVTRVAANDRVIENQFSRVLRAQCNIYSFLLKSFL
jgi:hypothetical protein